MITEKQRNLALAAGLVAGVLFALATSGAVASVLMVYTPYIPLLMVGFALGLKSAIISLASAALVAALSLGGLKAVLLFMLLVGMPILVFLSDLYGGKLYGGKTAYFPTTAKEQDVQSYNNSAHNYAHEADISGHDIDSSTPVGEALTSLTFYTVLLQAIIIFVILETVGDFTAILPEAESQESQLLQVISEMLAQYPFLLLGISAWVQLLLFYGLAVFANFIITGWQHSNFNSMAIEPFMPRAFLLILLMAAGLLSFSSDLAWSLVGKTAFITLLFPYFLMGISMLHKYVQQRPNKPIILLLVYFTLSLIPYLVLCFIGVGLLAQGRYLSNRFNHDSGTDSNG